MTDRLFDQPVVKVFPDNEKKVEKPKVEPETSTSSIKRLKAANISFDNLPPPPTVSSDSINSPPPNPHNSDFEGKTKQTESPESNELNPLLSSDLHDNSKSSNNVPESYNTDNLMSYASIPHNNGIQNNIPHYANTSNSPITSGIQNLLKKEEIIEETKPESSAMPAYLQFSTQNTSSLPSQTPKSQETSIPSYASFSGAVQGSMNNANNSETSTQRNQNSSEVPLYAQFSNMSLKSKQNTSSNSNNTVPSYMQSFNQNTNSASYSSVNTSNNSHRSNTTQIQQQQQQTPVFVPARQDFVFYHGYRSTDNRQAVQAPAPSPVQPTSWMNVYSSQSDDELFVLQEWFRSVDQDNSGEIDTDELEAALNAAGDTFEKGTVCLMVKIFDIDRNGTIEFNEFARLFKYINVMRQSFDSFDIRKQGYLSFEQTRAALESARYEFKDPQTFRLLYRRFCNKSQGITFEDFMQMAIFLGNLRTLFTLHDAEKRGTIQLNEEEFVLLDCVPYV